jgi:hypothetical protein
MITIHSAADRVRDRRPGTILQVLLLTTLVAVPPLAAERSREQGTVRGSSPSSGSASSGSSSGSSRSSGSGRSVVPRSESGGSSHSGGGRDRSYAGRRGHGHGGSHGGYYSRPRYYGSFGLYYGYPWGWWPWYGYGGYYPGYRPGYEDDGDAGALDLDVSPGRTLVFLDGQNLGTVDDFDGWPQYLWLDKGTYDLVLYLDGYRTVAKQVTIYPGVVMDVNDRLEPGDSVRPEDIPSKSHERRDARLEQDREMRDKAARERQEARGEDWRERRGADGRDGTEVDLDDEDEEAVPEMAEAPTGDRGSLDARGEPGRVRLSVEPGDASVYLDGRFLGTGDEIARLHSGLLVDAGEHRLAIVRPGRKSDERTFRVTAGEEVEVDVELGTE